MKHAFFLTLLVCVMMVGALVGFDDLIKQVDDLKAQVQHYQVVNEQLRVEWLKWQQNYSGLLVQFKKLRAESLQLRTNLQHCLDQLSGRIECVSTPMERPLHLEELK